MVERVEEVKPLEAFVRGELFPEIGIFADEEEEHLEETCWHDRPINDFDVEDQVENGIDKSVAHLASN